MALCLLQDDLPRKSLLTGYEPGYTWISSLWRSHARDLESAVLELKWAVEFIGVNTTGLGVACEQEKRPWSREVDGVGARRGVA